MAENFPDAISDSSVNVEVLRIERTFWEKATILHQFHFQSDPGRVAPGFSRHYYDVYQLVERGYSESALKDVSLLSDREFDQDFETACLEPPAKPVLSVTGRVNDR